MGLEQEIQVALEGLRQIQDADGSDGAAQDEAGHHRRILEGLLGRLRTRARPVTFIGPVGVGKSSVLAAISNLYVAERPTTPAEQRDRAVLPVGFGRTTVFPVRVRAPHEDEAPDRVALVINPLDADELRRTVEMIADVELNIRAEDAGRREDTHPDPVVEGLRHVILNMCGYAEHNEIYFDGNLKRTRKVRPLDSVIPTHPTLSALTDHLLERMSRNVRTRLRWDLPDDPSGLLALKESLRRVNQGLESEAPLPEHLELVMPALVQIEGLDGDLQLNDTCGLEVGTVTARADIVAALRLPDAVKVLCSSFTNAPGPELRELLRVVGPNRDLKDVRDLGEGRKRILLLVIDKGEAESVVGADRNREIGQMLRADECWRALESEDLCSGLRREDLLVFDPLLDDTGTLVLRLGAKLAEVRASLEQRARAALADSEPIRNWDTAILAQDEIVNEQLLAVLRKYPLEGAPLQNPLVGLQRALAACPYAPRIRATLRREGHLASLDLYSAVESWARGAAMFWLTPLFSAMNYRLSVLVEDDTQRAIRLRLEARKRALADVFVKTIEDYGQSVRGEVECLARGADVWQDALAEWGKGPGFFARVIEHFERWGKLQPFSAHLSTTLIQNLPLLAEVEQPEEAPGLTLEADRLRRLRRMRWELQGVNLLVGANGAGKTTTLSLLRFFAQAIEGGAELAASQALAVGSNLRTWGEDEREPVRLTLGKGETRWTFELRPLPEQRSVAVLERLTHRDEEVFALDEQRRLVHRGMSLGVIVGRHSGLSHLMKTNRVDLPVQRMARLAEGLRSYRVPDFYLLREGGSQPLPERPLESAGGNVFSVLQRLRDNPARAASYEFVLESLRLAFPGLVESLGFNLTERAVELFVVPPGGGPPNYIGQEADGVLHMLVSLVAIASAEPGEVVALDQPDDGLHPYAARVLLRQTERWAHQRRLTVIFATHSVVLLDAMKRSPERVFVMTPNAEGVVPNALTDLYNRDWLDGFELGELYRNDEIGSNVDDA